MSKSKILIMVSGSIAAYKACYLVSRLKQAGYEVKVAASQSALNFVGEVSFEALSGEIVSQDTFEIGGALDHIHLMRWADLVISAPATGNFINKIANGIADDFLGTLALAHDFTKPFLIAPAMNTQMYLHPATQSSIAKLKQYGFSILETASGVLACNEIGSGKLLDPDLIFNEIEKSLGITRSVKTGPKTIEKSMAPKILITSGGCVEPIDDVRAITNTSTGNTGAQIAQFLYDLGFEIDFLGAKNGAKPNREITIHTFSDFKSLEAKLNEKLEQNQYDAIIHAAAISDYSVKAVQAGSTQINTKGEKISSNFDEIEITLQKNPKLIDTIKAKNPNAALIGFKLTCESDLAQIEKAIQKQISGANSDLIIHNSYDDIDALKSNHWFNIYDNRAQLICRTQGTLQLAQIISNFIIERFSKREIL